MPHTCCVFYAAVTDDLPHAACRTLQRNELFRCILQTFWHSSSHALGEALEAEFGADLTIGPALEEGFYYDCYLGDRVLTDADKPRLQKRIEKVQQTRLCKHVSADLLLHIAD